MKKSSLISGLLVLIVGLACPFAVNAQANTEIKCDKTVLNAGETAKCSLNVNTTEKISGADVHVEVSDGLKLVESKINDDKTYAWQGDADDGWFTPYAKDGFSGTINLGTFSVVAVEGVYDVKASVKTSGSKYVIDNDASDEIDGKDTSVEFTIAPSSSDATIKSLKINGTEVKIIDNTASIEVGKDVNEAVIEVILNDKNATFEKDYDPRKIELKEGNNEAIIRVVSEDGKVVETKIVITKTTKTTSNETVTNPNTGIYVSVMFVIMTVAGIVTFTISKNKNYFNKI